MSWSELLILEKILLAIFIVFVLWFINFQWTYFTSLNNRILDHIFGDRE